MIIEPNPFGGGDLVAIDTIGEGRAKLAIIRGKGRQLTYLLYNKRPMGNIAHLRKQFKSINT